MARIAVVLTFPDPEKVNEVRPVHRDYLRSLLESGKLYATGPFMDNTGALLVYEAEDEDAARALLAADPYSKAGVVEVVLVKEWKIVMEGTAGSGVSA